MTGDLVGFGGTITATPDTYDTNTPWIVIDNADLVLDMGTYPLVYLLR